VIQLPSDTTLQQQMLNRGLPRDLFRVRPFVLDRAAKSFRHADKRITRAAQLMRYEHCVKDADPYIMVIASNPNDQRARLLAAHMMGLAFKLRRPGFEPPLWHWVNGSFADKLRDKPAEFRPSMLVLSNLVVDSTAVKFEKVRDLLTQYSNIPRIVVCSGCDPLTIANSKLHMAIQYCMNLGHVETVQVL